MKKILLCVILSLSCFGLHGQVKELILGRWDLVKTIKDTTSGFVPQVDLTTEDPEDLGKEDKTKDEVAFYFTPEGIFQELRFGRTLRSAYKFISNEVLVIDETTFRISLLTSDTLRIEPYEEMMLLPPDILVFKKSQKPFKLIEEFEDHLKLYHDGQKKEEGRYHNGLMHGIWQEWYPNGQIKSRKIYLNGTPIGTWKFWDEHNQLIKEEHHNKY